MDKASLSHYIKKYWLAGLLLSQVAFQGYVLLDYDLNSVKFLPRVVSLLFIALIVDTVCFSVFFFLLRKRIFKLPATLGLLVANILIYLTLYHNQFSFGFNQWLGDWLINHIFHVKFINVAVSDGNLSWGVALGTYIGIGLIIYGQWFVRKKTDFDNKVEKQLIYMGLGLYLVLFPFVFVFTHFTFVGSNYQFMQAILKYTDSAVHIYETDKQHNNFEIKELRWYPDLTTAIASFKEEGFKQRVATSKNKTEFYNASIEKLERLQEHGWYDKPKITYDKMERFHDWAQVSYNFNLDGVDKKSQTIWYSEISTVLFAARKNDEDLLRHSVLYLHQSPDGSVYAMMDFNRVFKDHKMNYIFNLFFVLYHLIYLGLFVYLITLHDKKHLGGKHV